MPTRSPLPRWMILALMAALWFGACSRQDDDATRPDLPDIATEDMDSTLPDAPPTPDLGGGEDMRPDAPPVVEGLQQPVEILIDADGLPHLYAQSDQDLFYAAGYQVASERLFTLDVNRRAATGRVSEIYGESAASADIQAHVLGFEKWAGPSIERMWRERPEDYRLLAAYVAGVNRRVVEILDGQAERPVGFDRIGYDPEPFTPQDLMAIGIRIQFGYSNTLEFDLLNTVLRRLNASTADDIPVFTPGAAAFTMEWGRQFGSLNRPPQARPSEPAGPPVEISAEEMEALARGLHQFRHNLRLGEGSNAWSIHGDYTDNGRPIVANDSHAGLSDPNDLYLMHLNSKDAGGAFDVMGFGFIGIPGVQLGHNDRLAWAATTNFSDMTDLWEVSVNRG